MNPESFSSLPEGQWLLQQVQTAFPNCSADEQLDGVAILCTIQQTIGHPRSFGSVSRSFSSTHSIRGNAGCCRFSV